MKLGIIGVGAVGTANLKGFERLGHEVVAHDIKYETSIDIIKDTEIVFICVPTPSTQHGSCDTSIVLSVIEELAGIEYKGIVAIRSTVTPGFTEIVSGIYESLKLCFVPEFLRERCAEQDFFDNHNLLAVGTEDTDVYKKVISAHEKLPKHTVLLSSSEAEVLKYYNNVYASLRVTFANIMYELCDQLECDYSKVKNAYIKTGRSGDMYLDVNENLRGYSGMCLPKDTKALHNTLEFFDLEYDLIKAIENDNNRFIKTVFSGMRGEE